MMNFNNTMSTFKNTMYLIYNLASHVGKMILQAYTLNLNTIFTLNLNLVSTFNLKP